MKEFRKLVNIRGSYGQEFSVLICFDSRWCRKTPGWPVCVAATKHRVSSQAENCLASVDSRQRPRLLPSIGKYLRRISPSPSTKAQQTYFTVNCWGVPPPSRTLLRISSDTQHMWWCIVADQRSRFHGNRRTEVRDQTTKNPTCFEALWDFSRIFWSRNVLKHTTKQNIFVISKQQ